MSTKITYRLLFAGFLVSILITFFLIRPLNSPWQKFIAGDGLGYYGYLPAGWIYEDNSYHFKWFNEVHSKAYMQDGTASADDHFLVKYKDKRINKYYPGLSVLWVPFFALAHACAHVFHFPADGYSLPYQWSIGLASLFYLFLGLFYLRKLVFKWSGKAWIALLVPVSIFYGTHLFEYAIHYNSLSHVYSFCLITVFSYYVYRWLNEEENRLTHLCVSVFLLVLVVSIRPLNILALGLVPALYAGGPITRKSKFGKWSVSHVVVLLLTLGLLLRQFYILKISTGEWFPNTYQDEPFSFHSPQVLRGCFGFQYGMFLYAPLLFFSFSGVFFYPLRTLRWILPILFAGVIYFYASWWFWPIVSRATIDFYIVPALLLTTVLSNLKRATQRWWSLAGLILLCVYYQFKIMQFNRGILDRNYTTSELYFNHFFKVNPVQQFVVPPYSIIDRVQQTDDFEAADHKGHRTRQQACSGVYADWIDHDKEFGAELKGRVPEMFYQKGIAKIRYSAKVYAVGEMKEFQVYVNFSDTSGTQVLSLPYYVNENLLDKGTWTEMQFGHEFSKEELFRIRNTMVNVYVWNSGKKNTLYLDDLKLEFLLCDRSAEIVP